MKTTDLIGKSVTTAGGGLTVEVAAVIRIPGETYLTGKVRLDDDEVPGDWIVKDGPEYRIMI